MSAEYFLLVSPQLILLLVLGKVDLNMEEGKVRWNVFYKLYVCVALPVS